MSEIKLEINENDIPLNPIISKILTNIVMGFIEALKGIPEVKKTIKLELTL